MYRIDICITHHYYVYLFESYIEKTPYPNENNCSYGRTIFIWKFSLMNSKVLLISSSFQR